MGIRAMRMPPRRLLRVFLDSNVLMAGLLADWGLPKAILSLGAARVIRLVIAEAVRLEVEENLLLHAEALSPADADGLLSDYDELLRLVRPEVVALPSRVEVSRHRSLIRHEADVPVLLSAMAAAPDWFVTRNTDHFDDAVAARTGLRIVTPRDFFAQLVSTASQRS